MVTSLQLQSYQDSVCQLLVNAAVGYAIVLLDAEGNIASWNSGAERLLGYSDAEIVGRSGAVFFTPEDCEAGVPARALAIAAATGQAADDRWHLKKDGSRFFSSGLIFPLRNQAGTLEGFVMIMRDQTSHRLADEAMTRANQELQQRIKEEFGRRQAEAALSQSQQDFQMLMNSATEYAIMLLDRQGVVLDWNSGAEKIVGFKREEVAGQYFSFFFTPEDTERAAPEEELQRARSEGKSVVDKWHMRKNGERFYATGMVHPMLDRDGNLRGFAKIIRDNTANKLAEEQTNYLANHDVLTGIANRTYFSTRLREELAHARRENNMLALLMLDLDKFKHINDTLGHHAGDLLLQEVAKRLSSCVRQTDMVARLGGDEFVVIQTALHQPEDGRVLAAKIVHELGKPYQLEGSEVHTSASVGVTVFPTDGTDSAQLLKNADIAMYRAKGARNSYQFFTEVLNTELQARKQLEDQLRQALKREELELYYQPQIDLASWRIVGAEALLRWKGKDLQSISISESIRVAEENGMMVEIGEWVINQVCRQISAWQGVKLPKFRVAINLSPVQFRDRAFLQSLKNSLEEYNISASCLEMEITERLLLENTEESNATLHELKQMGVQISVDDFGSGYSALSYLRNFPVDVIKIDQSLVQHLPFNQQDVAIASSIINLAHNLGIKVVAEGVESTDQLAFLKNLSCTSAQGYLFQPPVPASQLESLMRRGQWSYMNAIS